MTTHKNFLIRIRGYLVYFNNIYCLGPLAGITNWFYHAPRATNDTRYQAYLAVPIRHTCAMAGRATAPSLSAKRLDVCMCARELGRRRLIIDSVQPSGDE